MRIGIYGYGNLGRAVEKAVKQNPDIKITAIFTRRDPKTIQTETPNVKVCTIYDILRYKNKIDVMIICGGSATDLPEMTPTLAKDFNVLDSFDTHTDIKTHFAKVDGFARTYGNVALISAGWDPGIFSLARLYASCILPESKTYTFWGKGVSQGHSEAVRNVYGVEDARQYTVPKEGVLEKIRNGECPDLTAQDMHRRECFVVAKDGYDQKQIATTIENMPSYFAGYETDIEFISGEKMALEHAALPHGGTVITNGKTGLQNENNAQIEYSLKLDSNPEFTGSVLLAYARALYKMSQRGEFGCKTVFDVAPADLSPLSPQELREKLL